MPRIPIEIRGMCDAQRAIAEHGATESFALLRLVHGKAAQHGDRDRIRHVAAEPADSDGHGDRA